MKSLKHLAVLMVVGLLVASTQAATYTYDWNDAVQYITLGNESGSSTPLPAQSILPNAAYTYAGGGNAFYTVYDMSDIGAGETVTSATLSFYSYASVAGTPQASRTTADWVGLTGYSTVLNYWNTEYDMTASGTEMEGDSVAFQSIDVRDIVSSWVDDGATNLGLRVSNSFFAYVDDSIYGVPMTLTVETTPAPEPTSMALLGVGGLAMLYRRRRRR